MKQKILFFLYNILGYLAKFYIKKHNAFVIGITGSIGKTSCRMIIYQILEKYLLEKHISTSQKNFNGELGMSLSIFEITNYKPGFIGFIKVFLSAIKKTLFGKKSYDIILLEYGIDHIGEMDFLLKIVKPHISIITKIDKVHSMQMGNPQTIAKEKYKLCFGTKETCFVNYDDEFGRSFYNDILVDKFFYTTNYKLTDEKIDIKGKNYSFFKENTNIKVGFDINIKGQNFIKIKTNLFGNENIGYISVGFVILDILYHKFYKNSFLEINKGKHIEIDFKLQNGRFGIFDGICGSILIDSTYNASPLSMRRLIENSFTLKNEILPDYKLMFCLGDMRELGQFTESEHRELAKFAGQYADKIFVVGENMGKYFCDELIKLGAKEDDFKHFKTSKALGEYLKSFLYEDTNKYVILFKGSQNTIFMEEALKQVLLNPSDSKNLPRQDDYWLEKKSKFFENN